MKVVINRAFGGFGLSEAAYEKLIEYGVPVRAYVPQKQNPVTRLWDKEPLNDGGVIFDRLLVADVGDRTGREESVDAAMLRLSGRYWDNWINGNRTHPLLIRVVEELGEAADGRFAKLKIVEIPDGVEYQIDEYDGMESIHEAHRTWE